MPLLTVVYLHFLSRSRSSQSDHAQHRMAGFS